MIGCEILIARKSLLIFTNNLICAFLGYIAVFVIARYMGEPVYALGIIGFCTGFLGMFYIISSMGYDNSHIKRISEGMDTGKCIGTFIAVKLLLTGVMVSAVLGTLYFWENVLGRGYESETHRTVLYIFILIYTFRALATIPKTTFTARRETAKAQIPVFTETVVRVAATVAVVFLSLGVVALAETYLAGALVLFLASLLMFRKYPIKKPERVVLKSYTRFALPLFVVFALATISMHIDKIMLQFFWGSEEVGYYFSVQIFIKFIISLAAAVATLLFPTISQYHARGDITNVGRLSWRAERYISMIIFPVSLFLIVLARPFILIFLSSDFYPSIPVLQLLLIYAIIISLQYPYSVQMSGQNRPDLVAKLSLIRIGLNISLNLLLIPSSLFGIHLFGMKSIGACLATVVAIGVTHILIRFGLRDIIHIKHNPRILLHIISAEIMAIFALFLDNLITIERWYEFVTVSAICMLLYMGLLYLFKEFTKEDFQFFKNTVHPVEMLRYIFHEVRGKHQ